MHRNTTEVCLGLSTTTLQAFFDLNVDSQTRGHSWKKSICRSKLNIRKYFFSERLVNRWNQLSQNDVDQTSVSGFKRVLERRQKAEEMDFFCSLWSHLLFGTGVATPGKISGLDILLNLSIMTKCTTDLNTTITKLIFCC